MIYYGEAGRAVGSVDGDWLFDETGEPIGHISNQLLYDLKSWKQTGWVTKSAVYSRNTLRAFSGIFKKRQLLAPLREKLSPVRPRLVPKGPDLALEKPAEIPESLRGHVLCSSLAELRDDK